MMGLSGHNWGFKDPIRTYNILTDKGEIPSPLTFWYIQELRGLLFMKPDVGLGHPSLFPGVLRETAQLQPVGSALKLCFLSCTGELDDQPRKKDFPASFLPDPVQHLRFPKSQIDLRRERGAGCTQKPPGTQTLPWSQKSTTKYSTSQQRCKNPKSHHSMLHRARFSLLLPKFPSSSTVHVPFLHLSWKLEMREQNRERRK